MAGIVETGTAAAGFRGGAQLVAQVAWVFRTRAQAATLWRRAAGKSFLACRVDGARTAGGLPVTKLESGELAVPKLAQRTVAYRVIATAKVKGQTVKLYDDDPARAGPHRHPDHVRGRPADPVRGRARARARRRPSSGQLRRRLSAGQLRQAARRSASASRRSSSSSTPTATSSSRASTRSRRRSGATRRIKAELLQSTCSRSRPHVARVGRRRRSRSARELRASSARRGGRARRAHRLGGHAPVLALRAPGRDRRGSATAS